MGRAVVVGVALLLSTPFALFAETADLRAQIRADIMQDPRSAEMSDAEINTLVEALADEAEETGAAGDYLESHSTFDPSSLFTPPEEPSAVAQFLFSPLTLAIALLLMVLCAVIYYIVWKGKSEGVSDLD